jgi:hypothetical protein
MRARINMIIGLLHKFKNEPEPGLRPHIEAVDFRPSIDDNCLTIARLIMQPSLADTAEVGADSDRPGFPDDKDAI